MLEESAKTIVEHWTLQVKMSNRGPENGRSHAFGGNLLGKFVNAVMPFVCNPMEYF